MAGWEDGGTINNFGPTSGAFEPCLVVENNIMYATWFEYNGSAYQIYAKQNNGSGWTALGTGESLNIDPMQYAWDPCMAVYNGTPYVTWYETGTHSRVFVKHYNSSAWQDDGPGVYIDPNQAATHPCIALDESTPYVAWSEDNGSAYLVHVKYFNGSDWAPVGGSLNYDPNQNAYEPSLVFYNHTPYIAWAEYNGGAPQIFVKYLETGSWTPLGGSLNINPSQQGINPVVYFIQSTPYVAWQEMVNGGSQETLYVKYYHGSDWTSAGGTLNLNVNYSSYNPGIISCNNIPYAAWEQHMGSTQHVVVAGFNGSDWTQVGGMLNINPGTFAFDPSIAFKEDVPYVAWSENGIHVKYYFTPTSSNTPTLTMTATPTPSMTQTPIFTASPTTTSTPTISATDTPTFTITPTATISPTPTITQTVTLTATASPANLLSGVDLKGKKVLAYPNPAKNRVTFLFHLDSSGMVKIEIYNMPGERVASLSGNFMAGKGQLLVWNSQTVSTGVYFARVSKDSQEMETLKVAIIH